MHRKTQTKQEPVDVLLAQRLALQTALGTGLRSIETPELGRVEYANVDQIIAALGVIDGQIQALQGGKSRTEPVIALSGLWP